VSIVPLQTALQQPGVRIDKKLVVVEAVALLRCIGTIGTQAVQLACLDARKISMPYLIRILRQHCTRCFAHAVRFKKTNFDPASMGGKHSDVDTATIMCGTKWVGHPIVDAQSGPAHRDSSFSVATKTHVASGGNVSVSE
jgi:hypothetical protein